MALANASSVRRSAALSLKARQESGRCEEPNKPFQPWRGEMSGDAASDASYSPLRGPARERQHRMVFVVDKHKRPLMPCTPKRSRLPLAQGRPLAHHPAPVVIV